MTSSLIPTRIVNRNGVSTTVYRREASGGSVAAEIPVPKLDSVASGFDREEAIVKLLSQIRTMGHPVNEGLVEQIRRYSDDLLLRLKRAGESYMSQYWMIQDEVARGESESRISESLYFYPMFGDRVVRDTVSSHVAALHHYKQLPVSDDYSKESLEVRDQCAALITVAQAVRNLRDDSHFISLVDGSTSYAFKDDRVTDLILEHYDHASEIADLISERRSVDPELIREILFPDIKSLGRGIL